MSEDKDVRDTSHKDAYFRLAAADRRRIQVLIGAVAALNIADFSTVLLFDGLTVVRCISDGTFVSASGIFSAARVIALVAAAPPLVRYQQALREV